MGHLLCPFNQTLTFFQWLFTGKHSLQGLYQGQGCWMKYACHLWGWWHTWLSGKTDKHSHLWSLGQGRVCFNWMREECPTGGQGFRAAADWPWPPEGRAWVSNVWGPESDGGMAQPSGTVQLSSHSNCGKEGRRPAGIKNGWNISSNFILLLAFVFLQR